LKSTENHEERIQSVENVLYNAKHIFSAFKNIMCIGDSLTYGAVYTAQSEARQAYRPYPAVLGTLTGATIHQYATAGYTAKLMWSHFGDNIIQRDGQLVILYAGTNGGLTDTMDTDMTGSDYTQWADTNTGCYGKIIAKAQSVGAKVLLIKVYHSVDASILQTTNEVIDKMATKFSIPVVDAIHLTETIYHYYPDKTGINNIHYNDFGYSEFAHRLYNAVISMSETDLAKILIS
jgi:lysophospholipase L1-like esterase